MAIVVIASCFGFLVLVAVFAFAAGDGIRAAQRRQVGEYVARRSRALARRREERNMRAREEALQRETIATRMKNPLLSIPGDQKIVSELAFVEKVARETPEVFAKVIRWCVHNDPAVLAWTKLASLADDLERPGSATARAAPATLSSRPSTLDSRGRYRQAGHELRAGRSGQSLRG